MNKKIILSICLGLILLSILLIILKPFQSKDKIEDFGKGKPINQVISNNTNRNFDLTIDKGSYQEGDAVYIFRNNSYAFFGKYVFTLEDVQYLKNNDLDLFLGCNCNKNLIYEYYVIKKADINQFEEVCIKNDPSLEIFTEEYFFKPQINSFLFSSSLENKLLESSEYGLNNEKITIILMQSQVYQENTTISVTDKNNQVIIRYELTSDEIKSLEKDNYHLELDASSLVNTIENTTGGKNFTVSILLDDKVHQTMDFTISVQ